MGSSAHRQPPRAISPQWFAILLLCGFMRAGIAAPDYAAVHRLFTEHCLDCHAAQDAEGQLVLENFETLMRGGVSGPSIVRSNSASSLLVRFLEGTVEKKGKKLIMPPGKRPKLKPEEIALVKAWIDGGAPGPTQPLVTGEPVIPKIVPTVAPRLAVKAMAASGKVIAIAREGEVELRQADNRALLRKLGGHRGGVNALVFSPDEKILYSGAGEPGRFGEIKVWRVADGNLIHTHQGHADSVHALAVSPDGQLLASGSYDQKIILWKTNELLKTLSGHNGAIFDLSFRRDGKILASASADRTVKLWDVESGLRRDTLAQSLKELHAVAFSPDGVHLVAGGVDNRIRIWQVSSNAAETTNPLLDARFAHEGSILRLVFSADGKLLASSADDRTVKVWEAPALKVKANLETQPDWPAALAFAKNQTLAVGCLDGTVRFYDAAQGKLLLPPPPVIARIEPRGIQRGVTTLLKVTGSNLHDLVEVKAHHAGMTVKLAEGSSGKPTESAIMVSTTNKLARGSYELSVVGPGGESGRIKVQVDDLPQVVAAMPGSEMRVVSLSNLPVSCWGALVNGGDTDTFEFRADAGQTIVFDLHASSMGSKLNGVLTLIDDAGRVLAVNNDFSQADPLLVHTFERASLHKIRVSDLTMGASRDHFYRLSIGSFPFVTGTSPLSVQRGKESKIGLLGYNIPDRTSLDVKPTEQPEFDVAVDPERFRFRQAPKVLTGNWPEVAESEPNDTPSQASVCDVPASISGSVGIAGDSDFFKFSSDKGQIWVIETTAAQRGTPVDTKIEVLHLDGRPVERILFQAVRNSAITFRAIDSITPDARVDNWEEMELNQFLYMEGEVVKIFRMPQGPDSGFLFYTTGGKRRAYFDTMPTAHALDESCYIVEPVSPGTPPRANGLPTFVLNYANDDDGERRRGTDSKLLFTAPQSGGYLVRVTDTRNFGGHLFVYRLVVRPAQPDFEANLQGMNPTVAPGSGQTFTVSAERKDGFEGAISIAISGLPAGWTASSPLVIEAGHDEAKGTLWATPTATEISSEDAKGIEVEASAEVKGTTLRKRLNNFGTIKLGKAPKLLVYLGPESVLHSTSNALSAAPCELTLRPGQTISALLKVVRTGHDDLVSFSVENLPHGVIVDNIGLNGVLIPKDQAEREIFLTAAKWVPETDRLCFAVENQAGRQTSAPVLLRVRRSAE